MSWVAVGSAAVTVVGGAINSKSQSAAANRAAKASAPYNISGPFGSITYGPDHNANFSLGQTGDAFSTMAQQLGMDTLGNYKANPLDAVTPDIQSNYNSTSALLGKTGGQQAQNSDNLFAALQQFGNDPTAIGNHMYQLLRAQAQPGQDQAYNDLQQKLYSQGRLGTSGGGTEFKGFFDSANQADTGRQIAGAQFGAQYQNQLQQQFGAATTAAQNTATQRYSLAGDLLKTGMSINSDNVGQSGQLQGLYQQMFAPLMQAGGFGQSGNQAGANYQYGAARDQNNMWSDAIGGIAGLFKGGTAGGGTPSGGGSPPPAQDPALNMNPTG